MPRKTLAAAALLSAASAFAAIPPAYLKHLPPEHEAGPVAYIDGGATRAEADSIKRAAQEYPLEVVFEQEGPKGRKMLGDMPVTITDAHGRVVFRDNGAGPYLIARLPRGRYFVTTHWDDWSFTREVDIGADRQRVVFDWRKGDARA